MDGTISVMVAVVAFVVGWTVGNVVEYNNVSPTSGGYRACMKDIQYFGVDAVQLRFEKEVAK